MAYKVIIDEVTEAGKTFSGKAEECTFSFSTPPEQLWGETWLRARILDSAQRELAAQGSRVLRLRVSQDTEPTWQTDYIAEVWATASPIFWTPVILGILVIFTLVLTWRIMAEAKDIDWKAVAPPIAETTKWAAIAILAILALTYLPKPSPKKS